MENALVDQIKKNFTDDSLSSLDDSQVLQYLLSFAVKGKALDVIADKLLNRFGSLSEVLEAPVSELVSVGKISENAAVLLSLIPDLCGQCMMDKAYKQKIRGKKEIAAFASQCYIGKTVEDFLVICMNDEDVVIGYHFMMKGAVDWVNVDIRKIVRLLNESNASALIVCHNHPRGNPIPSGADLKVTKRIANAVVPLGYRFVDHMIFSVDGYHSMADDPNRYGSYFLPD